MNGALNIPLRPKPRQQFAWRVLLIGLAGAATIFTTITILHNLLFIPTFNAPEEAVYHWDIKLTPKHRRILETYAHMPLERGSGRKMEDILSNRDRIQLHFDANGELIGAASIGMTPDHWERIRRAPRLPFQYGAYVDQSDGRTKHLRLDDTFVRIRQQGEKESIASGSIFSPSNSIQLGGEDFILPMTTASRDEQIKEAVEVAGTLHLSTLESTYDNYLVDEIRSDDIQIESIRIGDREIINIDINALTYYLHLTDEAFLTNIANFSSSYAYPVLSSCPQADQIIHAYGPWPLRTFAAIFSTEQSTTYCFPSVEK